MPRCPVCSVEVDLLRVASPPFCGERCRLVDLGRWLDESYSVPDTKRHADDDADADGEQGAMPPPAADDESAAG